jgi:cytosine/adenosine deaminase-related metal-dependent hydrolase
MSLGESDGGLPPDRMVEDESTILRATRRAIETFHDAAPHSMLNIAVAPCSPFSVSEGLMCDSARLARGYGVRLHTHLAETADEEAYCLRRFGKRPVAYAESLGWLGDDVWHVHCVHLNDDEVERLAATGTGVCHSPSSNMRLGSGIAPVRQMLAQGVSVSLGVDGSASNDSSHLLAEGRQAFLLQRVAQGPAALSTREALWMLTQGGAAVLGRDDLGALAVGKSADMVGFMLDRLPYAGALHNPLAAVILCAPQTVELSVVAGKVVVNEGRLVGLDLPPLIERHNRMTRNMLAD